MITQNIKTYNPIQIFGFILLGFGLALGGVGTVVEPKSFWPIFMTLLPVMGIACMIKNHLKKRIVLALFAVIIVQLILFSIWVFGVNFGRF